MSPRCTITLTGLNFSYDGPGQPVLQNLSLEAPPGAVTALLGPNGSGKTTLLSVILGVLSPQAGTILIDGKRRDEYSHRALSQLMGLVPQDECFPFGFSVQDYVLLGRAPHLGLLEHPGRADLQATQEALETSGLTTLADRPVVSLSGGERQLATVARALAQQPRILLLDEPTSHLDLANKSRILNLIRALAQRGVTIVLTTHDPNAAAGVANHVVLMRQGQAIAAGHPQVVLNQENLSATYGLPVQVTHVNGRPVILTS